MVKQADTVAQQHGQHAHNDLVQHSGGVSAEMRENNVVELRRNWLPLELGNKGVEVLKAG